MPTVTTEQVQEVKLKPALKRKLALKLKTYAGLKTQAEAITHAQAAIKSDIEKFFTDADQFEALQAGVRMDGFTIKHVSGVSSRLDKKLLVAQGVSMAQIEAATTITPKKAYLDLRCPGGGNE